MNKTELQSDLPTPLMIAKTPFICKCRKVDCTEAREVSEERT